MFFYDIISKREGKNMKKITSILLVIIWMVLIFIMSSFNGNNSSNQSNFIVNIISNIFNINNLDIINYIVRKAAHLTEYTILGILTNNMIKNINIKLYIGLIICIIYAISDEIHQFFIPGRTCQILDICIDSLGILIGLIIYKYYINFIKKTYN